MQFSPFSKTTLGLVFSLVFHLSLSAQDYEQGLTFQLYDIQEDMDRLYPLVDGQTPNVDEKHDTIDYTTPADFENFDNQFLVILSGRIEITTAGSYEFRLTSDDGSILFIDNATVITNDNVHGPIAVEGTVPSMTVGPHPFEIRYFDNTGDQRLLLEWKPPGASTFSTVPATAFSTVAGVTRVVAPGKKILFRPGTSIRPGNRAPLTAVHPSWTVHTVRPNGFEPKVGAMTLHPDGRLLVATFPLNQFGFPDPAPGGDGKVYAITNTDQNDRSQMVATEIAANLSEPLGMKFIGGELHVTHRDEITKLTDSNSDGYYETHETVANGWISDNYAHFHYGLAEQAGFAYSLLSVSINRATDFPAPSPPLFGLNGANPPNRGTLVKTNLTTGAVEYVVGGLRNPNGIGLGPEGTIICTDNQGAWLPSSKIIVLEEGKFYGHYNATDIFNADYPTGGSPSLFADQPVTPPAIWLPQNEISNSPSEPVEIPTGIFAGQYLMGEVTLGGIRRASFEKVNGVWQGCIFRFSQGFEAGINRITWAPDGSLYAGMIGGVGNWSWKGTEFGLQRLTPKTDGTLAFEIKNVKALPDGFELEYTKPLDPVFASQPSNFEIKQWNYIAVPDYGGPKQNQATLLVTSATLSPDGRRVRLSVPQLREGYVHHINAEIPSATGEQLWATEAWYTLNEIPTDIAESITNVVISSGNIVENSPIGTVVGTFSADHTDPLETVGFSLPAGVLNNDEFAIDGDNLVTSSPFDFERRDSFTILVQASDTTGNFRDLSFDISVTDQTPESPATHIGLTSHILTHPVSIDQKVGSFIITDPDLGDSREGDPFVVDPNGDYLARDNFEYQNGALAGNAGGVGFSGAWTNVTGTGTTVTNGIASQPTANARIVRLFDTSLTGPFASYVDLSGNIGEDGTTLYISYLERLTGGGLTSSRIVEFRRDGNSDSNTQFTTGVGAVPGQGYYGMRIKRNPNPGFTVPLPGDPSGDLERYLLKVEFGPEDEDTVTLYHKPTPGSEGSPVGSVSTNNISFDRIGFGSFQMGGMEVSDIRVADTFDALVSTSSSGGQAISLAAGAGDIDNDKFTVSDRDLLATQVLAPGTYSVRVRTLDSAGLTFEQQVFIYVGDGLADDDGDGINNSDEVRYSLDPDNGSDADLDTDQDGQSNKFEITAGTDPFDPSSIFSSSFTQDNGVNLSFNSRSGNAYSLMSSLDLSSWTPYGIPFVADSDFTMMSLPGLPDADSKKFFQLRAGTSGITPINLLENGLVDWTIVGNNPSEWSYDAPSGILTHTKAATLVEGFIHRSATYTDFVLKLQYRISQNTAGAGILLRADQTSATPWIDGSAVQLDNDDSRGELYETGSILGRLAADPAYSPAPNVWHSVEIHFIGPRIKVNIDGITMIDVLDSNIAFPSYSWPTSGIVGLQALHNGSTGQSVEYRNVMIYPFP